MADPRGGLFRAFSWNSLVKCNPGSLSSRMSGASCPAALRHRPLAERGNGYPLLEPDEETGSLLELVILPWITEVLGYQVSYGLINSADYGVPQVSPEGWCFIGSREHELGGEVVNPSLSETGFRQHIQKR